GRRYLYFNTGLKPSGLRYVYVAPYDAIYEKVRLVQVLTLVAMLAGLAISLIVSGFLVRRQYTPVSHILQNLDPHELRGNEYERIAQAIERGKRERVDLGQRLAESRQLLGGELLDGFLTGRLPYNANTFRLLTTHGMAMDKPLHCVVCLRAEAQGSRWEEEEFQDMASELFHIRLAEQLPGLSAYRGFRRTPVVWVLGVSEDRAANLAKIVQACQDSVALSLGAQVDMSLSACTADVALLPDRYRQADTALEYAQMHADGKLVVYPEQPGNVASYYYQVEDELTLIQAVREGREDRVHAVLDTVAERYAKSPNVSMIQCLRFDLIATCYRAFAYADSVLARERWYDETAVARLNRSAGLRDLDRCVRDILSGLCRAIQTQREARGDDLSDRICAFVREHWQEADLSVAVVAEHFAMHASYVSRMFKEEKGMGLLEYINRYRIEQSIAPLLQGLPMAQVAAQCGFTSDASLIRVFKQYMGMTPGKYREIRAERS
ncbi:MAG TPA: helix-turn-helix transcriptional regulator, partial [Clostridia bacterium]|nr:helix-turn-helix transcriptional regulator [Clostridia bacterium]